jgi:signal transduction histidine kinase
VDASRFPRRAVAFLKERMAAIGGELSIHSRAGAGTSVNLVVHLDDVQQIDC